MKYNNVRDEDCVKIFNERCKDFIRSDDFITLFTTKEIREKSYLDNCSFMHIRDVLELIDFINQERKQRGIN